MDENKTKQEKKSIQRMIIWSFTIMMIIGMGFVGVTLYQVFDSRVVDTAKTNSIQLIDQATDNLEDYLYNMQSIRDSVTTMITEFQFLSQDDLTHALRILYMANKDKLVNIACYTDDGNLVASVPYAMLKKGVDITSEEWFTGALKDPENGYIGKPRIQNELEVSGFKYYWVISSSKTAVLEENGTTKKYIIVVDMNYSSVGNVFRKLNEEAPYTYTYLMDEKGNLIYHPKANLISAGLFQENALHALEKEDGSWEETFEGKQRLVTMQTLGYTDWKIVRVTQASDITLGLADTRYLVIIIVIIAIIILMMVSTLVSSQITKPLNELTDSIKIINEDGLPDEIYVGGSYEVKYLGETLLHFVERLRTLMDDMVKEQEEKRKSELDALQSQINPHFLYNTLDSIVWMIEGERYQEAIFMIRQLASLFRISLSKGKTMITIADELKHAENYMNIQKVRYRNRFEIEYDVDEDILGCVTVKLILQPILENALYYAVEALDGDGEILVRGYRDGDDIYLKVIDNGMGMTQEMVEGLLVEGNHIPKHGSGVGLMNIHKRLQIRFGEQYGLQIESELDEGTTVTVHLPYQLYEKGE